MALIYLGKKPYTWTNPDTKITYSGIKMHCMQELPSPGEGYLTDVVKIPVNSAIYPTAESLPFKTVFTPVYDRYGRIADIIVKSYPDENGKNPGK